jgi:exodeoxyribonuclease X
MKIIFFDTETTGNAEGDRLCQLAVKERGSVEPIVNALYKPPRPITLEAMEIHHITEKMVEGKPAFEDSPEYERLKALFEDQDTIAVAHNAAFDVGILAREMISPRNVICTYKVASALDPNDLIPSYRLQYLRYFLGIDVEASAHDAYGDILVLEALFERLLSKMEESHGSEGAALAEMLSMSSRPLLFTTIRFGKHKGKRLSDVAKSDRSYLEWLLAQKKQEPVAEADWIYTLEYHLAPADE